ncbi:coiled-coil domain-containing protein 25 isoform X2 [Octopus bimaculoides]|uniref:coiled-coil domain-containing protein 25 isoform X2 n=1 Tax=Octopus bimaculoides TaxID=37653 RepID=UPI00071C667A|nr:coiled-coil domain-containing protein 25 isoform X2 [Octopus bimaculoides]|eukprot:XP_014779598.1 PREDICTED: coiled-coil domain-containing protein 25-like isoform X2 [Octopus bimaculoides]
MVFYYTSTVVSPSYQIYMGLDKYENEDLIKWGFPEDVWFHVDKVSSAHVYLRLHKGDSIDDIPQTVIDDCAQLVKANSIQGNKMNNVDVVYTMWSNLKKTPSMDVGQVGFNSEKEVHRVHVEKRQNSIVNRLLKTKEERSPDLRAEREQRDKEEQAEKRKQILLEKQREKEEIRRRKEQEELRSYASLMKPENMTSNFDSGNDSDDFM